MYLFFGLWCILSWCIFFYGLYMLGGDTLFYVFISIIISCFTCVTLAIDLYYKVMIYVFYFSILWNQEFILFYLYFPHLHLCVCWVFQEYTCLSSCAAVYTGNWLILVRLNCLLGYFVTLSISILLCVFFTDCQRGSLLGSKTLRSKCIRTSMCNVGKSWSKPRV